MYEGTTPKPLLLVGSLLISFALTANLNAAGANEAGGELEEFTVISAENFDSLRERTFEGHKVADLIPERLAWQIKDHGLKITVKKSEPGGLPYDPRILEATAKYSGAVSLDPETYEMSGYKAGIPFPDVDMNDPLAPVKVIYNYQYAQPRGDHFICPFTYVLIDGESGVNRIQEWRFNRYYMTGRVTGGPPVMGDGEVFHRSIFQATAPHDIKGLGFYAIHYNGPRLEDTWAYIRTVRRVRRLSGGAWIDPIGSTDLLQDDVETWNAHPAWYSRYKLLGKKFVLAPANSQGHLPDLNDRWAWRPGAEGLDAQFPRLQWETAPHWNPKDVYEVREVYLTEAIPPEFHPYSKRTNWFDANNWRPYYGEGYDKKGEFWKWLHFASKAYESQDGWVNPATGRPAIYMFSAWGVASDWQRRHATMFNVGAGCAINPPNVDQESVSLAELEAGGS
ncbi:MAG: DUF1329 domain-containing protein [Alphaproteobacteria bacterium]